MDWICIEYLWLVWFKVIFKCIITDDDFFIILLITYYSCVILLMRFKLLLLSTHKYLLINVSQPYLHLLPSSRSLRPHRTGQPERIALFSSTVTFDIIRLKVQHQGITAATSPHSHHERYSANNLWNGQCCDKLYEESPKAMGFGTLGVQAGKHSIYHTTKDWSWGW